MTGQVQRAGQRYAARPAPAAAPNRTPMTQKMMVLTVLRLALQIMALMFGHTCFNLVKFISAHAWSGLLGGIDERKVRPIEQHQKELTTMFCDIRGFTSMNETHRAPVIQRFLTRYYAMMNGIIVHDYGGSINKLIGDGILAYWGFPHDADQAYLAINAALKMKVAVEQWNQNPYNLPLKIGIGINTGEAFIGHVGSQDFIEFTVIGDSVNMASRLEKLNKAYETTILVSQATYEQTRDLFEFRSLGTVLIRGKQERMQIYEPIRVVSPELIHIDR